MFSTNNLGKFYHRLFIKFNNNNKDSIVHLLIEAAMVLMIKVGEKFEIKCK